MVLLATIEDVQDRVGRTFSSDEAYQVSVLIDDASAIVLASFSSAATNPAAVMVVAGMVKRALTGSDGVKSETVGPYSVTYDNAQGSLYLTAADRTLLGGVTRGVVGSVRLGLPQW